MVKIVFWKEEKPKKIKRQATPTPTKGTRAKPKQVEKQLCRDFIKWLRKNYPFYYDRMVHIPNEGRREFMETIALIHMGFKSGEPDYNMAYPNSDYYGLFIEAKPEIVFGKPKPKVSDNQKIRINMKREDGYCGEICFGLAQMKEAFLLYISNDPDMKLQSAPWTKRYKRIKGETDATRRT